MAIIFILRVIQYGVKLFTGLIESLGIISGYKNESSSTVFSISSDLPIEEINIGDSIAVNGVCLTVESVAGHELSFTAVQESLKRSSLKDLKIGTKVNLERALKLGDRLDGHIVQGHVDGVGTVRKIINTGNSILFSVKVSMDLIKFAAEKGSVALDGVSLTIASTEDDILTVSLIPQTLKDTTLSNKRIGDLVNIECDLFARYIYQQLKQRLTDSGNDEKLMNLLENGGF